MADYNFWRKHQTLLFLNNATSEAPDWVRVKLSTVLEVALNANTEDFDFIADENPTTIVDRYQPSITQENMAKEGDACFDMLWDLFYNLPKGSECEKECLIVFPKAGGSADSFEAWKFNATLVLSSFNAVDKRINYEIRTAGDITTGTVTVEDGKPTFVTATA